MNWIKDHLFFVFSIVFFVAYLSFINLIKHNDSYNAPTFQVDTNEIEVSVYDESQKLLEGVHAIDKEDGDLSHEIMIESLSSIKNDHTRVITYGVYDHDDHLAKISRTVRYIDYENPRFKINRSLHGIVLQKSNVLDSILGYSCVDGYIKNGVTLTAQDEVGVSEVPIKITVSDSFGGSSTLNLKYHLDSTKYNVDIQLNNYIVYLKKNETFDYSQNINSITMENLEINTDVMIDIPEDIDTIGVHEVTYTINYENLKGKSIMNIIVEET